MFRIAYGHMAKLLIVRKGRHLQIPKPHSKEKSHIFPELSLQHHDQNTEI